MTCALRTYGLASEQYRKRYYAAREKNVLAENNRTAPKPASSPPPELPACDAGAELAPDPPPGLQMLPRSTMPLGATPRRRV